MQQIDSKNGIIGLAIGDAMGVPLEFSIHENFLSPITEMMSSEKHNVPKGTWSDDTSLTIATIDSIARKGEIDLYDIGQNFVKWRYDNKFCSIDKCFDIGKTTIMAIARLKDGTKPEECGGKMIMDNGNGSLMRILPVAYYCYYKNYNDKEIYNTTKAVSSITHAHEISIMGCYIYVKFALELLNGNITEAYKTIRKLPYQYFSEETKQKYNKILSSDISKLDIDEIFSSGYIVKTLETTLWVLLHTKNFNQAIIGAINFGGDADTIGACVGGLAGIYYGLNKAKESWKKDILKYDYLVDMCNKFNEVLNKDV